MLFKSGSKRKQKDDVVTVTLAVMLSREQALMCNIVRTLYHFVDPRKLEWAEYAVQG